MKISFFSREFFGLRSTKILTKSTFSCDSFRQPYNSPSSPFPMPELNLFSANSHRSYSCEFYYSLNIVLFHCFQMSFWLSNVLTFMLEIKEPYASKSGKKLVKIPKNFVIILQTKHSGFLQFSIKSSCFSVAHCSDISKYYFFVMFSLFDYNVFR